MSLSDHDQYLTYRFVERENTQALVTHLEPTEIRCPAKFNKLRCKNKQNPLRLLGIGTEAMDEKNWQL